MITDISKKKKKIDEQTDSKVTWKQLLNFYKQVKIPWLFVVLTFASSIALKQATLMLVPYESKIMTAAITGSGFVVGFAVMTFFSEFMDSLQGAINELTGQIVTRNARHSIWRRLLHLPMSYFDKGDSQSLVSRITQDTTNTYAIIAVFIQIVSIVYGIYSAFRKMFITYKSLALIMLSGIPIILLTSWLIGKMEYKIIYITNNAISKMTNFFAERLPNVIHIKTCNNEDEEYQNGVNANNERYKQEVKAENLFIFTGPIGSFAQYFNEIILLVVATALVRSNVMKMFQLVNLYNYYLVFMSNSYMLIAIWQSIKTSHGTSTTIAKIMDTPEEDLESGSVLSGVENITFEHVSFSYDGIHPVLKDVSFVIPKGKKTVIVGENGCGKSTIIKLLERFEDVQNGCIRIGSQKIEDVNLYDLREKFGYVFQGNQIIKGSIKDNITYGINHEYSENEVIEASKLANAYDFIQTKENGFDTEISGFDTKVSGGEMQRIAIARNILKKPNYMILDEATSGIDIINANTIMHNVSEIMKDKTMIMVSHDIDMMKSADHIIVLNDGMVEASGNYEEVKNTSILFQQFLVSE